MSYPVEAVTIDKIRELPAGYIKEYLIEALHSDLDGCYEYEKQCIHRFLADMIQYVEQCAYEDKHHPYPGEEFEA